MPDYNLEDLLEGLDRPDINTDTETGIDLRPLILSNSEKLRCSLLHSWNELSIIQKNNLLKYIGDLLVTPEDYCRFLKFAADEIAQGEPYLAARMISVVKDFPNESYIPVLANFLNSPDKRVRANSVEALGMIGGARVKELILPFLEDSDNRVKANAAVALWNYSDIQSKIKTVFEKMLKDQDRWMKASAFYAFGETRCRDFFRMLVSSLDDDDEIIGRNALLALLAYAEKSSL